MRIPITTQLSIESFSGGVANRKVSGTINAIYGKRADGTVFITQRPAINIYEDCSGAGIGDAAGRGVYYWNKASAKYFVNSDTVYKANYGAPLAQAMSAGVERVEFFELGEYLVIIDSENNEGWYIHSAATTTLIAISAGVDADFPPNQATPLQLTKGGAVIGGVLYVGATNGEIWNSGVETPLTWGSADFITAEVQPDDGVMIYRHVDHIAAFGTRSIQFFYNNANPTGSPLNVRQDVAHEIGAVDFDTVWAESNTIYFVGQTASGSVGVYVMSNFSVSKISTDDMDSMLTSAINNDGISIIGSGFTSGGRAFYLLTVYNVLSGVIAPDVTYVYGDGWGEWELAHTGINDFPLMGWTQATGARAGEGILSNGDLITVIDSFVPIDTSEAQVYVADGYVDVGYVIATGSDGNNIYMEVITGQGDSMTLEPKFADRLRVVATPTDASQTVTVYWSDEGNNNYNSGRTIDISNAKNKLNRCGSYRLRNYKLAYEGSEQVEIEGIEVQVRV